MDLWVSKRVSTRDEWGPPENLGPAVNSSRYEIGACISADGLTLYFSSDRELQYTDIYMTTRPTRDAPWSPAVKLGPNVNYPFYGDSAPWVSPSGLELYFSSWRPGGYGESDIYVTSRPTTSDSWGEAVNLGPVVNSAFQEFGPCLSPDGLLLFFSDDPWLGTPPRPGGYGSSDIWMARRARLSAAWQTPVNLGPKVNSPMHDSLACQSADGLTLYFSTISSGGWPSWQAPILLNCDLNSDGEVDEQDIQTLEAHWGQDYALCDIGPMPWGDGIVDMRDLVVLMKYMGETDVGGTDLALNPRPDAVEVPGDTVLSWVGPGFADSYDVYLGTSFDDVSNATRDDPCGVLVSEGHAETTFDPEGLLEFGQTYYWRVDSIDVVIGSLEPMIYRGPVLKFTTEPFARPIQNITATASSRERGMGPENTVNGSGLDKNDGHSTDGSAMWLSTNAKPHWIQFEFDKVYALHELWVWNSNQLVEPILGFGAKTVKIEYSVDGVTWTMLEEVPEFARAPGEPAYKPNTTVNFGGVLAKHVKLSIEANWGPVAQTGLAEVRFFYIPDRPWATMP